MTKHRAYEPIAWKDGAVRYLDQVLLPQKTSYIETHDFKEIVAATQRLSIRGAPLIGIAGAYAVVLASAQFPDEERSFLDACDAISRSRPTAVNLRHAVDRMRTRLSDETIEQTGRTQALLDEARRIHEETVLADDAISDVGAELLSSTPRVLTLCNTGPLATGGNGTAFGMIAAAWDRSYLTDIYACETRPLLQGARLTMWEFKQAGIPATLLHDSAVGSLFFDGKVDAVVVGADRIAANGDTANKIGTSVLAVLADAWGVPFYVAAPRSTIDPLTPDGKAIPIEVRDGEEVASMNGIRIAPSGIRTYSPAFDVTPSKLIAAIVTERGVLRTPYTFARSAGTQ